MVQRSFVETLMMFSLTRQEAAIYQCLLGEGKTTGYEVAKQLGISRSNAYNSLASLTEKGGAYLAYEGKTKKYAPVKIDEFCKNHLRHLEEAKSWLVKHAPDEKQETEGYITIEGEVNILDKMKNLLLETTERAYISCNRSFLLNFIGELEILKAQHKKVVIITDQPVNMPHFKIYYGEDRKTSVGLIVDSRFVMTGEYGEGGDNTCLYSGQKYFVDLYKKALANEIKLLALKEGKKDEKDIY
ncbi:sugar-specific transcriptional regulator TrmB [Lachnospiraceae bacterium PF1-21]|uniref:TrmB family transcriptional regulator n=1 Tax=Ohessyouella blattaphilus TaxID=2949333 RepID=A0ABT1EIF6_9FIRM|nr:TrmB family transcriptional regulator [Ohessyouella blattaphilus]MCP1109097.1 TrmB family transcriptional regulator [Ohessyouella blattaphilus]MCR8562491.1 TrmB family transcriptional regulator [Ohessyouella blattaphilus]MDL2250302.1 TrmB family transcriptional regulator [Lachnospiraceae bacterium OttesenSCG-928-J05]